MSLGRIPTEPLYRSGFHSLQEELAGIRRRLARGRERADDARSLEELELALAELRALYRAALRAELELDEEATPLDRALLDVDELVRDKLSLRTIPPAMRDALKREREADYALLLYELADSGPSPVSV